MALHEKLKLSGLLRKQIRTIKKLRTIGKEYIESRGQLIPTNVEKMKRKKRIVAGKK